MMLLVIGATFGHFTKLIEGWREGEGLTGCLNIFNGVIGKLWNKRNSGDVKVNFDHLAIRNFVH